MSNKVNKLTTFLKPIIFIAVCCIALLGGILISIFTDNIDSMNTNTISEDKMLLVLSAPSIHDTYYSRALERIVEFQINYAKAIMGHDNVVVIVDADTKPYYEGKLPEDVLLTADVYDIWMRDFTTANPLKPVQFIYTWASMTKAESEEVQRSFDIFAKKHGIERTYSNLLLDGGNIVDNYAGKVVVTKRFLSDNDLTYEEGKQALKDRLGAIEVAIVEPDEDALGHSDGMVMWIDENTLLVNNYKNYDAEYRESVLTELKKSFPTTTIIEVPVKYKRNPPGVWEGFSSACGVNVNSVLTYHNIYVPVFNTEHDQIVVEIIKQNTTKNVITINAEGVCPMGGSVRCLTWQLTGANAEKLILAARSD